MTVLNIRTVGDPVLRTPCRPASGTPSVTDEGLRRLVADMYETMDAAGGIGLAANQVGAEVRVFTFDAAGRRGDVVDPHLELLAPSGPVPRDPEDGPAQGENLLQEGCLSVASIHGPVDRALRVRLTGTSAAGDPVDITADGLLAACFQHEVDHLDGRLFVDRLRGEHRREAMRTLRARDYESAQEQMRSARTAAKGGSGSSFFAT
ncbi:MAG: peptide deformylase [Nesterenkonia sp.]|uniref:peptide deformylase n=1 Tax=Nesterenkonia marinintestina TaxID=2979865 RepID=UPI0021BE046A|nr:peptide deformylase [Nesterenkonia sp. GX14115]MDO5493923.1 peptide deformylase [Nesterenkonia sp.]